MQKATDGIFEFGPEVPKGNAAYAAYLFDAIQLYAIALDKVLRLQDNQHKEQHELYSQVAQQMKAVQFEGASGAVQLDMHGDRLLDVEFLNVLRGDDWPVVARYSSRDEELHLMDIDITWMGGGTTQV